MWFMAYDWLQPHKDCSFRGLGLRSRVISIGLRRHGLVFRAMGVGLQSLSLMLPLAHPKLLAPGSSVER